MSTGSLPPDFEHQLRMVAVYANALNVGYWVAWIDGQLFALRADSNSPLVLRGRALTPVEGHGVERDVRAHARWYVAPDRTILDLR